MTDTISNPDLSIDTPEVEGVNSAEERHNAEERQGQVIQCARDTAVKIIQPRIYMSTILQILSNRALPSDLDGVGELTSEEAIRLWEPVASKIFILEDPTEVIQGSDYPEACRLIATIVSRCLGSYSPEYAEKELILFGVSEPTAEEIDTFMKIIRLYQETTMKVVYE